jgi:hypothetical protein
MRNLWLLLEMIVYGVVALLILSFAASLGMTFNTLLLMLNLVVSLVVLQKVDSHARPGKEND